ncbi:hypothetical protein DID88_009105 [Monilinia fructigena]|uniref:Uncharacterized protein n=1 Tax=Monilinia fructigena TaxID=38457 RepID=A0A395IEL4_9HELO|nr:hypothetical protein DID88_009105 [Monilinia fructigena]
MKYSKWISIGRKEKAKDDIAIVDDPKDGSKLKRKHGGKNLKDSAVEERSPPTKVSSETVIDAIRNLALESVLELSDFKESSETSLKSKRKSWYSISRKRSEESKPKAIDQSSLYDQTGTLKDQMITSQATRHTRDDVSSPNNPITIIVTSPTSDAHFKLEDWSSPSSSASSLSRSSLSSTSSFDTTRLMPPSISPASNNTPNPTKPPKSKKWLIGCMNRKADTLPRKLVYRMMELYNIKEHELDPRMLDKLHASIEDEGIVLPMDIEPESKDKNKVAPHSIEALHHLRTPLHPHPPAEGKEKRPGKGKPGHPTNTAPTNRNPKNNTPPPTHPKNQPPAPTHEYGKTPPRACETGPPPTRIPISIPTHAHPYQTIPFLSLIYTPTPRHRQRTSTRIPE